jgi:hypothetical protein
MHPLDTIYVTNRNDFVHLDRYDGEDYIFDPGVKVPVSIFAAELMFGFGLVDKTAALLRHGWAFQIDPKTKQVTEHPDGVNWLRKFTFSKAVMVEETIDEPPPSDELEEIKKTPRKLPRAGETALV